MKTINLALGVHNHQPVGNFDHVIAEACERCYFPFFKVLERHPSIKFSVHFSGYLLFWIAENYPEIIHTLKRLVERGQVELLGGGFYEPILAIIPDEDKLGQIRKLTAYLHELFKVRNEVPDISGMWLAERVWEPHLPKTLAQAGIKYVCVDDFHFKAVGKKDEELLYSYVTEEQGHKLEIFPINQKLRYIIPFEAPSAVIDHLKMLAGQDKSAGAFYFDDGEKFGVWPGTHELVFTKGWLEEFFEELEKNSKWIKLMTFGEYHRQIGPSGRIYLPTASYAEMMEWALPADRAEVLEEALHKVDPRYASFLKGGYWRHFLVKYPEANHLQKRMLQVSKRLQTLQSLENTDKTLLEKSRDLLWRSQSNDPYWHGVFGGLYLTNLRTANYQALVGAEAILDKIDGSGLSQGEIEQFDLDCDGKDEIFVSSRFANYVISPSYGGSLMELDYKDKPFNLVDTLSRRLEPYHAKLKEAVQKVGSESAQTIHGQVKSKEADLDKFLVYDWHRRLCFLDHFWGADSTLESVSQSRNPEQGDFTTNAYQLVRKDVNERQIEIEMERHGYVWINQVHESVAVNKTFIIHKEQSSAEVHYKLINHHHKELSLWFAPELNFNLLAPDADDRFFFDPKTGAPLAEPKLSSSGEQLQSFGIGIADHWLGVKLSLLWNNPACLWRFPVFTVSNSEAGFERIYQGSAIVPNWTLVIPPQQSWQVKFEMRIDRV